MADSDDKSTTFSDGEAISIVTTSADPPLEPATSSVEMQHAAHPIASTWGTASDEIAPSSSVQNFWGLRPRDLLLLVALGSLCLALSIWHWGQISGWGQKEVEIDRLPERVYDYRIDINEATWVQWMQLPGVGETLAQRILEYREQNGPFQSVDDLDNIQGIGPKTLEKLRPWLFVQESERE